MRKREIKEVTLERVIGDYKMKHVDNDIALMESLRQLVMLTDARRFTLCVFVGFCTNGIVTLTVNDKKRTATANNVMVFTDGSVVDNLRFSDDFEGFGMFISYDLVQDIVKDVGNVSDLYLMLHSYPVFDLLHEEMVSAEICYKAIEKRISTPTYNFRREVSRLIILILLYDMDSALRRKFNLERVGKEKQSRSEEIFVKFMQSVEQNFKNQRQVQWYAKTLGISPKYLYETIMNVSKRSPNEWIDKFVTAEIRNQLRHTSKKIGEIAEDLNFPTQSFLGKYFKENVGMSPSEYRNAYER
jgi:AraC-like DNA-binding protein